MIMKYIIDYLENEKKAREKAFVILLPRDDKLIGILYVPCGWELMSAFFTLYF